VIPEQ